MKCRRQRPVGAQRCHAVGTTRRRRLKLDRLITSSVAGRRAGAGVEELARHLKWRGSAVGRQVAGRLAVGLRWD